MEKESSVVFEADIPSHMRRGSVHMTVVLTSLAGDDVTTSAPVTSRSSSNASITGCNTLQVPDVMFSNSALMDRRRSLSCLQDKSNTCLQDRRSSTPFRRASCGWSPILELRKQFLPHRRRSGDTIQQVKPDF